jgi:phospholipid/cholesterol/gamma-HCH transport system permease protein
MVYARGTGHNPLNTHKDATENASVFVQSREDGEVRLGFSGRISLENLNRAVAETRRLLEREPPTSLIVDLTALNFIDSAGALFLLRLERKARERQIAFRYVNMSERVRSIMGLFDMSSLDAPPLIRKDRYRGLIPEVGLASVSFLRDLTDAVAFGGMLVIDIVHSMIHPGSVRWKDVIGYMRKVGVDALPILALISFLMGLIIAFMSSLQLRQFGANAYVASLVAIGMVRELGPIITAILVAGRSGSAFAAEIGAMKTNEEIDALVAMGFSPIKFLVVPKIFAAVLVVPILTFFSDLFGIIGGMAVGIGLLDLSFSTYREQTSWALTDFDIVSGIVKTIAFAVLIAGVACQRGFQVRGGAESVGNAATSAVVAGLFLIIVSDSVFAIMFNYIRY